MIASQMTHSTAFASEEIALFLKRARSTTRDVKDRSKGHGTSKKIVPLDEIVYIEGTVSVAF
jgi:hypothetical protein